jgi:repressor LexA
MLKLVSSTASPRAERSLAPPSERQLQILRYIHQQLRDQGYPPTVREIGNAVGLKSTNGVAEHLRALISKGYLAKDDKKSRALVPTDRCRRLLAGESLAPDGTHEPVRPPEWHEVRGMVEVPLLGRVAAGAPILAEENVEDVVRLDSYFLGGGRKVFALRVKGDSMIGDGIFDGDTLFVRQQDSAERGTIVVFLIEGDATVKRYFPEGDRVRLQPSNPAMAPIYLRKNDVRKGQIAGVVVGVYRKF